MLPLEVLIREGLGAVDACRAGSVSVYEVTSLTHEIFDLWYISILALRLS